MIFDLIAGINQNLSEPLPTVIGQPYQGGFYAGVMRYTDGDYILLVAPKSSETSLAYRKFQGASTAGSVFDGAGNTTTLNNATHPAGQYCSQHLEGGFEDWYLPARDELELAYRNFKPDSTANNTSIRYDSVANGLNANSVPTGAAYTPNNPTLTNAAVFIAGADQAFSSVEYWSSTQYNQNDAVGVRFGNGEQTLEVKTSSCRVRPFRKIKIT